MTQVSYYISVNRGYNFLGFAIGVFIQLPIIYQLIFFYEANTQQYSIILFGIPIAAAIFQGIITLNYAKTLAEKEQVRSISIQQYSFSAFVTSLLFYVVYFGLVPALLRLFNVLDNIPFVFRAGFFEIAAQIIIYSTIWYTTKRN